MRERQANAVGSTSKTCLQKDESDQSPGSLSEGPTHGSMWCLQDDTSLPNQMQQVDGGILRPLRARLPTAQVAQADSVREHPLLAEVEFSCFT